MKEMISRVTITPTKEEGKDQWGYSRFVMQSGKYISGVILRIERDERPGRARAGSCAYPWIPARSCTAWRLARRKGRRWRATRGSSWRCSAASSLPRRRCRRAGYRPRRPPRRTTAAGCASSSAAPRSPSRSPRASGFGGPRAGAGRSKGGCAAGRRCSRLPSSRPASPPSSSSSSVRRRSSSAAGDLTYGDVTPTGGVARADGIT